MGKKGFNIVIPS